MAWVFFGLTAKASRAAAVVIERLCMSSRCRHGGRPAIGRGWRFCLIPFVFLAGCADWRLSGPATVETAPDNAASPFDDPSGPFLDADTAFTALPAHPTESVIATPVAPVQPTRYQLAVLHVQTPDTDHREAARVWDHIREDVLDGDSQLQMRRNGFRVGVGHVRFWGEIKRILDGIPGVRVTLAQPLQVPAGFPIAMELDTGPRDQTLFYVSRDGVLSGDTWLSSRNILRVSYANDPRRPTNTRMWLTPEVHQDLEGWRLVRTDEGVWQTPKINRTTFDAAAFTLTLAPGEFALVAAGDNARVRRLMGWAFLTDDVEGVRYRSYVFLQPNAAGVGDADDKVEQP